MMRDHIFAELQLTPLGLQLPALLSRIRVEPASASAAVIEAILLLSPEAHLVEGRWRVAQKGKAVRILAAIEAYSTSTGKMIFRAGSALGSLPIGDHPTPEELREILDATGGRFTLLPNDMIRRSS